MRFMIMIKGGPEYEAGVPPSPELLEGMGRLADDMARAGVVLANGGLLPSSAGARIRLERGKRSVLDGPFAEAKEVIGGYAIVEARSKLEAIALAHRVVDVHVDAGVRDMEMEIRAMFDGECRHPAAAAESASCGS